MNMLELAILLSIAIIILFALPDMTYALRISVLGIIVTPVYLFCGCQYGAGCLPVEW